MLLKLDPEKFENCLIFFCLGSSLQLRLLHHSYTTFVLLSDKERLSFVQILSESRSTGFWCPFVIAASTTGSNFTQRVMLPVHVCLLVHRHRAKT